MANRKGFPFGKSHLSGRPRNGSHLRMQGRLASSQPGDQMIAASVAPDGSAVSLWAAPEAAAALSGRTTNAGGASFATTVLDAPVPVRVSTQQPDGTTHTIVIPELRLAHPSIAVLPDGELLVVGARCQWTRDHVEPNAAIFSAEGNLVRQGMVGDGVAQVATTAEGAIWIGYFDEGIFGNFGWGSPGPAPIGRHGLLRFDRNLALDWHFPTDTSSPVDDCSTINIDGETAWTCYYSDYPIARVEDNSLTLWQNTTGMGGLVLVDQTRVALIGTRVVLGRLADGRFTPTTTTDLDLPQDTPPIRTQFIGQGPVLHVITADGRWSTTNLDALDATAF